MKLEDVRQGTRVKYAGGDGQEHDAVALSAPLLGFSNAIHGGSHFLNLIYLDNAGFAVKVPAAALLTAAASVDDLAAHADITVPASRKPEERQLAVQAEQFRLTAQPRTIGWRPYREDEFEGAVAARDLQNASLVARIQVLEADLAKAVSKAAAVPENPGESVGEAISVKDKQLAMLALLADPDVAKYVSDQENAETIGRVIANALAGDNPLAATGANEYNQQANLPKNNQMTLGLPSAEDMDIALFLDQLANPDMAKYVNDPVNSELIGGVIAKALHGEDAISDNQQANLPENNQMTLDQFSAEDLDAVAAEANAHAETEQAPADPIPTVDVTLDPTEAGTESSSDTPVPTDAPSTLPEPSTDAPAEASPSSDPTPEIISDPEPIATE